MTLLNTCGQRVGLPKSPSVSSIFIHIFLMHDCKSVQLFSIPKFQTKSNYYWFACFGYIISTTKHTCMLYYYFRN